MGEGCSDGADLCSTSSFPCPMSLLLGREDVTAASAPLDKSVVGVCARSVLWALGLCPSSSLSMSRKRVSLSLVRLRKAAVLVKGKELKRAHDLELLPALCRAKEQQ